ncbi:excalibur calcium-binding domain-containing protein [Sulfurovum sp. NBC37-1]|uniref:excalibur calcium-binding domain-containing protein n=1 Tax=Sulfurovum sp. (strain NBC37-1) TaxID=387093 RepID=UPI0001587A92|nr:excalibur calcium-binding domain-containing protein [Sulfurovum sp. NBC37-1]BAF72745.1 hypothetical protein SUN_1798 [Sulfurovum sp. NBC37-1]
MIKILISLFIFLLLWIFYPLFLPVNFWNSSKIENNTISNAAYKQPIKKVEISHKNTNRNISKKTKKDLKAPIYKLKKTSKTSVRKRRNPPKFRCDKRIYCSQMHSYKEAKYFLDHCGPVKMDGDRDGIPCERQFGRH